MRFTSTGIGTFPLRKPGILTEAARSEAACSTAWWTSARGTSTVSRTLLSGSSSTWVVTRPLDQRPCGLGHVGSAALMRLFVISRHGESTLNIERRVNGDPGVPVTLTDTGRDVPFLEEPLLDDIKIGELEGKTLDDYREWKHEHTRADSFPGGESLDDAARRYAEAYRRVLVRPEERILIVTHEIPLRYAINAADGSDDLDGPTHQLANATPYLFDEPALERAVEGIQRVA